MASKIPFSEYVKIQAVNWSTLSSMRKSPLHYRYILEHSRPTTPALSTGRAAHTAVFEPDRFALEYAVEPDFGDCRKTDNRKERDAWRAANARRQLLTESDYVKAIAIRDAVRGHREAAAYLLKGSPEQTLTWTDPGTGLACKGRLDFVSDSKPAILDLKTTRELALEFFSRSVHRFGYHTQAAFYANGWAVSHGEQLPSVIIAVESNAPHDVGVFRLDDDTVAAGQEEYAELLTKVATHRGLNTWPGMYPLEMPLRLPPWAFGDDDEVSELGLED